MAVTPSKMLELNTKAPDFTLPNVVNGESLSLEALSSDKATVVMFICNHCPFVLHLLPKLPELAKKYSEKGVSFVAISSNDVSEYPQDSPEKMKEFAQKNNFVFPYLYDESQKVAKDYQAACTPDFYVFNSKLELAYRGCFDGSRPGSAEAVTGADLAEAIEALLEGKLPNENQKPSVGCNIKWKN